MSNKTYDNISRILDNPEGLSMDNLDLLVNSSIKLFNEYIEIGKSGDEEKKAKLQKQLEEVKAKFEKCAASVCSKLGVSEDKLAEIIKDKSQFKPDEMAKMDSVQNSIDEFRKDNNLDEKPKAKKPRRNKAKYRNQYLAV